MKSIATLAVLSTVYASTTQVKRQDSTNGIDDTTILNYALTLEHLENAFYAGALEKFDQKAFEDASLPNSRDLFVQIGAHEKAHVDFLAGALGDQATQPCEYNFPYTTPVEFAAVAQILEGVGVSAYAGAAQYISNPDYLTAAAVVLSTEARHASWVASAVNKVDPWSGALDVPLSLNQVFSLAAGFIKSCPESNPALPVKAFPSVTYSPTDAKAGDSLTIQVNGSAPDNGATAVFLTGLSTMTASIADGKVTVPSDLTGTAYMVIIKSGEQNVTDDSTIGGPAVFQFQKAITVSDSESSTSSTTSTSMDSSDGAVSTAVFSMLALAPLIAFMMTLLA